MKPEQILKKLGAPEDLIAKGEELTEEEFQKFFSDSFVHIDAAASNDKVKSALTGKITGHFKNELKKQFGIETQDGEKWEDSLKKAAGKIDEVKTTYEKQLEELKGGDDKVKQLQEERDRISKDFSAQKEQTEKLQNQLKEQKQKFGQKETELKVNFELQSIKSKLPLRTDIKGVDELLDLRAKKDLKFQYEKQDDGTDKLVARKQDDSPIVIENTPVHDAQKVLEHIANEHGLLAKNNGNGSGKGQSQFTQKPADAGSSKDLPKRFQSVG